MAALNSTWRLRQPTGVTTRLLGMPATGKQNRGDACFTTEDTLLDPPAHCCRKAPPRPTSVVSCGQPSLSGCLATHLACPAIRGWTNLTVHCPACQKERLRCAQSPQPVEQRKTSSGHERTHVAGEHARQLQQAAGSSGHTASTLVSADILCTQSPRRR